MLFVRASRPGSARPRPVRPPDTSENREAKGSSLAPREERAGASGLAPARRFRVGPAAFPRRRAPIDVRVGYRRTLALMMKSLMNFTFLEGAMTGGSPSSFPRSSLSLKSVPPIPARVMARVS